MPGWIKKVLSPKVLIPVVLVVGVIALLFSFGNPKKILSEMASFDRVDLVWIFLLSVLYEVVRFAQWLFLMHEQGVRVPIKAQVYAFAGGEATRFIPAGNYFQNYLLTTAEGADFAYTSAATTLIILYEVIVSLIGLVILGLGSVEWLRPVIVFGALAAGFAGWFIYQNHGTGRPPGWIERRERLRMLWHTGREQFSSFGKGASHIINPLSVLVSLGFTTIYLITAGGILYLSLTGVGWSTSAFLPVLAVYFFSLAFGLIVPLPVDIGVTELSGVGAFLAIGVERNAAISAMLINRVLTVGFSLLIFLIVAVVMRDETTRAWNARGKHRGKQTKPDASKEAGRPGDENTRRAHQDTPDGASAETTSSDTRHGERFTAGWVESRRDASGPPEDDNNDGEEEPAGAAKV